MASQELKDFLSSVNPTYLDYADSIYEGEFTSKAELGAADRKDLQALKIPKGAAGLIIAEARGAGLSQQRTPVDATEEVASQLCPVFPEPFFVTSLHAASIHCMLEAELQTKIPVPDAYFTLYDNLYPGLFRSSSVDSAFVLLQSVSNGLSVPLPLGRPTELYYTPFWQAVGFGLPEFICQLLGVPLDSSRNIVDNSIMQEGHKRDFLLFLQNVMVVGGEDKASDAEMENARLELVEKHQPSNMMMFGRLGYILLIATAGTSVQVEALPVGGAPRLTTVVPRFQCGTKVGRRKMLKIFINIVRWVRTVDHMRLLPPGPPSAIDYTFLRDSPYPGVAGKTRIKVGLDHVEKKVVVPNEHLKTLVDTYRLLHAKALPTASQASAMKVGTHNVDLAKEEPMNGSLTGHVTVTLQLIPVGCKVHNMTLQRLLNLTKCMLTTLAVIHKEGFVHRDLREENIVETQSGFCLIDWELAGRNGELVFWNGPSLPSDVRLRNRPFVFTDDLWQLGMTLSRLAMFTHSLPVYVDGLLHGGFDTAEAALEALQELQS